MSRTTICVQQLVGVGGVQTIFNIEEPNDVPDQHRSYILDATQLPEAQTDAVGTAVFRRLAVHPGVAEAFRRAATQVNHPDVHPICIETSTWEAERLPWEALHDPERNLFFALDARWPIARVVALSGVRQSLERLLDLPLRVTAVLAARDRDAIPEWNALAAVLAAAPIPSQVQVLVAQQELFDAITSLAQPDITVDYVPPSSEQLVQRILEHRPHLLHFFCHGSADYGGYLEVSTLPNRDLGDPPVSLTANDIGRVASSLLLTTLNCCEGAQPSAEAHSVAFSAVKNGIPAAIGMREPIDAEDAHVFCKEFFQEALGCLAGFAGRSGKQTLDWTNTLRRARSELCGVPLQAKARERKQWSLPVLYQRSEPLLLEIAAVASSLPEEDREYLFAALETLRARYANLHPSTPPNRRVQLAAAIQNLEQLLHARRKESPSEGLAHSAG